MLGVGFVNEGGALELDAGAGDDGIIELGRSGCFALSRGRGAKKPFRVPCFAIPEVGFAEVGGIFSFLIVSFTVTRLSLTDSSPSSSTPVRIDTSVRARFVGRGGDDGGVTKNELGRGEDEDGYRYDEDEAVL